MVQTTLASI